MSNVTASPLARRAWSSVASIGAFGAAVATFLAVTKGPVYHLRIDRGGLGGRDFIDDPWTQSVFFLTYVVAIAAAALAGGRRVAFGVTAWLAATPLVLLAFAAWSPHRERAMEQALMFLVGTIAAIAIGSALRPATLLWAVWAAMQAGLYLSVVAGRRQWAYSRDINDDVVGVYFNLNSLGAVAVMAVLTSALLGVVSIELPTGRSRAATQVAAAVGLLPAAYFVAHMDALVPLVGLVVAAIVVAVAYVMVRRDAAGPVPTGVPTRARVLGGGAAATVLVGAIVAVRDNRWSTVSDRFEIWDVVVGFIADRPIRGWGLMAAWLETDMSIQIQQDGGRVVHEAHNGYLEVAMGGGLLAVAVVVGASWIALRSTVEIARRDATLRCLWPLAAVVYAVTVNLGETYIGANLLPWVLLVAAAVSVTAIDDAGRSGRSSHVAPPG